jgi:predicted enzyme related to lactoylglutathione lyase
MKPKEIAFVVYPVKDVKRTAEFYTSKLGLSVTANWDDCWIEFDIGAGTLAITNTFPHLVPGAKGALAALEVDDFAAFAAELKSKGVPLATGPFDTPACKGGSIFDPDGNELIIHQRKT